MFSFHPGASKDKDIPIDKNTSREKAIQKVDEVSVGCRYKAKNWIFIGPNENIEYDYGVANAEEAVRGNEHVDECKRLIVDNLEKRNVDGQNTNYGNNCKHF